MEMSGQIHALGTEPLVPLNKRLGETQNWYVVYMQENMNTH